MKTMKNKLENKNGKIDEKVMNQIKKDPAFRAELCRKSFMWFFTIYFPEYIKSLEEQSHSTILPSPVLM